MFSTDLLYRGKVAEAWGIYVEERRRGVWGRLSELGTWQDLTNEITP